MPLRALTLAVFALLASVSAHAADADLGARVFKSQCSSCHAIAEGRNLVGPTLHAIIGRKAGEVAGFRYSAANTDAGWVWDAARLDPYLANPAAVIPGTSMLYAGVKNDEQRANLIAYLATLN